MAVLGTSAQHKLAVYEEIVSFLSDCYLISDVDDEDDGPEALTVNEPCLEPTVPQSTIEFVIEEILALRKKGQTVLSKLNSLEISKNAGRGKKPRGK